MQARTFDIVVVGRGAVGAAAALGLAQAGLRVCRVGPAASPSLADDPATWDSRVYALSPATRELLRGLRIWDALPHSRIAPVYDIRVYSGARADAPELHLDAYSGCVEALAWIIENRSIMATLEGALRFAGVESIDDTVSASAISGDYAPRAHATLLRKDTALAVQAAREAGFVGPLGSAASEVFAQALARGWGHLDDAVLFQLLSGQAGDTPTA
jgi:2-polyprenyl-6-methoxyphenol hydroxylase-like FAD-dependent oxidoreductase